MSRDALETVLSQAQAAYEKAEIQYRPMAPGKDADAVYCYLFLMEEAIAGLKVRIREWEDEPVIDLAEQRLARRLTINGQWPDANSRSDV